MSEARQKIAYAKGLLQGHSAQGGGGVDEVLSSVLDALDSLSSAVESMRQDLDELEGYVQAVDDDLFDVEADLYGYDEAEMTEFECPNCHIPLVVEEEFLEDDASEVTCPECGHVIHRGPYYEGNTQGNSEEVAEATSSNGLTHT